MASNTPLLRDGEYPNDEDEQLPVPTGVCDCGVNHSKQLDTHLQKSLVKLAICACLASLACTFLNISFLTVREVLVSNDIKFSDITLEAPNSYYGLENAVRSPTADPPSPISNPPFFAGYINQSAPTAITFKHNQQFTDFGTVYPTDRRFIVAPQVSTVLQFRVQDFGMERCTLTLSQVAPGAVEQGHIHSRTVNETFMGQVNLWRLQLDKRLDPHILSWNTRPQRSFLVASWDVSHEGRMGTPEFVCASGSIMTFELACAGEDDCRINFNQPREHPTSTLFLMQSSSL